ncbi:MAG: hypothetical protein IT323_05025 [Anaerolineae bacterium]|nr:hypothetical protein [Anaerolineae bacterium]
MFPGSLLPLVGVGLLFVGALLFWAAIQNWLADILERAAERLGRLAYAAQTALVVLDRAMVNGQRVYLATMRALFRSRTSDAQEQVEEVRQVRRDDLPADIRDKLDRGELLQYELSVGAMKVQEKHVPTYRLVVRRAE